VGVSPDTLLRLLPANVTKNWALSFGPILFCIEAIAPPSPSFYSHQKIQWFFDSPRARVVFIPTAPPPMSDSPPRRCALCLLPCPFVKALSPYGFARLFSRRKARHTCFSLLPCPVECFLKHPPKAAGTHLFPFLREKRPLNSTLPFLSQQRSAPSSLPLL